MHDYLRRSDSVWRTKKKKEDKLTGYIPSSKEKQEKEQPHQKMQMENSYGQMSLGISKSGDMTFVISGKKEKDETPAFEEQKRLNGDQMTRENRKVYSGNRAAAESAVVYKGKLEKKREKSLMLKRIHMLLEEEPNQTVELQMPFLSIPRDREQVKNLESMAKKARSNGNYKQADEYDHIREQLVQEIDIKQRLRREVMHNVTASITKAEEQPKEPDSGLWWLASFFTSQTLEEEPPIEDEEDDAEERITN